MYTIYSYGGGEYLYYIFNFVAMLVSTADGGISTNIIRMVAILGGSWTVILMYAKNSITPGILWFLWFMLASFVIVGPKGSVNIKDPIAFGAVAKSVDNVPLILAVGASTVSGISHSLTSKIESVFIIPNSPSYFKYIETGSLFGSKLIRKLQEVRIEDPAFNANLNRFVQQCVVYDAMIGRKYNLKTLRETNDIWGLVASNASPVLGFLYKDENHNSIITCKEGGNLLNNKWLEVVGQTAATHGLRLFGSKKMGEPFYLASSARNEFLTRLPQSYKMFGGETENAVDLLKQQMMILSLREAPAQKAHQLGDSYAIAKATLQQRNAYKTAGMVAEESLIAMRAVFEALIYGAFVFVYILIFLPAGYKVLGYYFQALCWIQLWAPLYAILNFIMTLWGHWSSKAILSGVGLTRANSAALIDLHTDITGLAGWLSLSVPAISFMIISKGGVTSFVHMASYLGSTISGVLQQASNDVTTGNISLGNFSQGNTNMQNMAAYKWNNNADFQTGQFTRNMASGATKITNPEGNVYLAGQGRTVSAFSTDISDSQHMAMQLNKHAQQEKSLMDSKATDYSNQVADTQRNIMDLASRVMNNETLGFTHSNEKSFGANQSLQNAIDFSKKLQKKFGVSSSLAFEASLGFSIPVVGAGLKFNGTGNFSKENIKDFAKSEGYKENFDSIVKAAQGLNFNEQQTKEKALVQQITSSYEKSNMLRESMSVHQQNAERLGKAATLLESSNYDTRTVMTQDFLDYVANSKGINSKGRIGYDTAASIIDATSGPLAERKQEFLQSFQEERTRRAVNYFTENEIRDKIDLDNAFSAINNNLTANKPTLNHSTISSRADEVKFETNKRDSIVSKFNENESAFNNKKETFEQIDQKAIITDKETYREQALKKQWELDKEES